MGTSTWTRGAAKRVQGSHVFEISGYSRHREVLGAFSRVESAIFPVGGYNWQIQFYPGGIVKYFKDYVAVYVVLESSNNNDTRARASVQLSMVDATRSSPPHTKKTEFDSDCNYPFGGHPKFKKRSKLESSPYLRDDCITIECVITLYNESLVQPSAEVAPSDIREHLWKLLQTIEGTDDVIFEVQGEAFPAYKTVLAMRSPVFKAELYGTMREKDMTRITIEDMQPAIFEALLYFINTDSLRVMGDPGSDDYEETIRHLLVTADRYALERLKMICENILCNNIDVKTVMTTLVLADQHHCSRLNDACIQFIASLGTTEMDDVMASRAYAEIKGTFPLAIVELWEKIHRLYNSKSSFHIGSSAI